MKCVVSGCTNDRNDRNAKKSFFFFPKEKTLQNKWLKFCGKDGQFNPKTWRVCIDHFNDEDIFGNGMYGLGLAVKTTLKQGAIPCRYNVAETTNNEQNKRDERRQNKKIVEELLAKEPQNLPLEIKLEEDDSVSDVFATNCAEDLIVEATSQKLNEENTIKELQNEILLLKRENRNLEDNFRHTKLKLEYEISKLKTEVTKSKFQCKNLEEKLKGIFTDGQIRKLKNGTKKQVWTQADIANAFTLYSASAKGYKLLKKKNFPLPAVRTLQHWAQKLKISQGVISLKHPTQSLS